MNRTSQKWIELHANKAKRTEINPTAPTSIKPGEKWIELRKHELNCKNESNMHKSESKTRSAVRESILPEVLTGSGLTRSGFTGKGSGDLERKWSNSENSDNDPEERTWAP